MPPSPEVRSRASAPSARSPRSSRVPGHATLPDASPDRTASPPARKRTRAALRARRPSATPLRYACIAATSPSRAPKGRTAPPGPSARVPAAQPPRWRSDAGTRPANTTPPSPPAAASPSRSRRRAGFPAHGSAGRSSAPDSALRPAACPAAAPPAAPPGRPRPPPSAPCRAPAPPARAAPSASPPARRPPPAQAPQPGDDRRHVLVGQIAEALGRHGDHAGAVALDPVPDHPHQLRVAIVRRHPRQVRRHQPPDPVHLEDHVPRRPMAAGAAEDPRPPRRLLRRHRLGDQTPRPAPHTAAPAATRKPHRPGGAQTPRHHQPDPEPLQHPPHHATPARTGASQDDFLFSSRKLQWRSTAFRGRRKQRIGAASVIRLRARAPHRPPPVPASPAAPRSSGTSTRPPRSRRPGPRRRPAPSASASAKAPWNTSPAARVSTATTGGGRRCATAPGAIQPEAARRRPAVTARKPSSCCPRRTSACGTDGRAAHRQRGRLREYRMARPRRQRQRPRPSAPRPHRAPPGCPAARAASSTAAAPSGQRTSTSAASAAPTSAKRQPVGLAPSAGS